MTTSTSTSLPSLPNEILEEILSHLTPDVRPVFAYDPHGIPPVSTDTGLKPKDKLKDFWQRRQDEVFALLNMCRTSRHMRDLATRHLYQNVAIGNMKCLLMFLGTLIRHTRLRTHVKCLMFLDHTVRCHLDTRVLDHRKLWRAVRRGHQGTDLDCRIFQLFGGFRNIPDDPEYEAWTKWSSYSKGVWGTPEFPSEHVVFGILMCFLNNLEHLAFGSTWLRNHPGDGPLPQRHLVSAMADPILSRQGVLSKLHTLELNPIVDNSTYNGLGAALIRIVPSLKTLNMGRSLYPWPADIDLPLTSLSVVYPRSRADEGKDLYHLCRSCPDLKSLSFQFTTQMGSLTKKALTSCADTLRELHVMFEASLPGRDMEPMIPLTGLPQLTRLETLYIDMSTLFGQTSGHDHMAVDNPGNIEELLPCASLRKLHVFNDYALADRGHGGHEGCGNDAADTVLEHDLLPLLAACDRGQFPHLRLVSVRTLIQDGGVFAREMVHAFAERNKNIAFVMFGGIAGGSRQVSFNQCCSSDANASAVEEDVAFQREDELGSVTKKKVWPATSDPIVVVKSDSVCEQDYLSDIQGPLL
ncbi:hypothetical protein PG984_014917 [Apiospora sp. TS-2023a]